METLETNPASVGALAPAETTSSEAYSAVMLAHVPDAVVAVDYVGRIGCASPRCADIATVAPAHWRGRRIPDVGLPAALVATIESAVDMARRTAGTVTLDADALIDRADRTYTCIATPVRPPESAEPLVIVTIRDVTDERAARLLLEQRSNRDLLTDLPNSIAFEEELHRALAMVRRVGGRATVLLFDIDDFRRIGEVNGSAVADAVLVEFARRLRRAARPSDLVARLERDRFAIVLRDNRTGEDPELIARRICAATDSPVSIRGLHLSVTCSVGVAQSNPDSSGVGLMGAASAACARAKRLRLGVAVAPMPDAGSGSHPEAHNGAVAQSGSDLEAWYQPIVDLVTLEPVRYEALLRWRRPDGSIPDAAEFIDDAVADGRIHDLGAWMLRTVVEQLAVHRATRGTAPILSVNVSHAELAQPGYPVFLGALLDRAGADPRWLRIEIDQPTLLSSSEIVRRNLSGLRELGVGIVVDHYGADAGALSSLRRAAVVAVKLDHRITAELLHGDAPSYELKVVEFARSLGIEVVATQVSTAADADVLRSVGCSHVQGAAFGRPQPASFLWPPGVATH